jgi:hypothetical protein
MIRRVLLGLALATLLETPPLPSGEPAPHATVQLRGRLVWMAEAMKRRYDVTTDLDAQQHTVAIETTDGELIPLVKDSRCRGFWADPRLFEMDVDLIVRKFDGSPMVQVISVRRWRDGQCYDLDYWCDICAISMFELKPCECCQGPSRLREQLSERAGDR